MVSVWKVKPARGFSFLIFILVEDKSNWIVSSSFVLIIFARVVWFVSNDIGVELELTEFWSSDWLFNSLIDLWDSTSLLLKSKLVVHVFVQWKILFIFPLRRKDTRNFKGWNNSSWLNRYVPSTRKNIKNRPLGNIFLLLRIICYLFSQRILQNTKEITIKRLKQMRSVWRKRDYRYIIHSHELCWQISVNHWAFISWSIRPFSDEATAIPLVSLLKIDFPLKITKRFNSFSCSINTSYNSNMVIFSNFLKRWKMF